MVPRIAHDDGTQAPARTGVCKHDGMTVNYWDVAVDDDVPCPPNAASTLRAIRSATYE
jgi:hypothetical protein